MKSFILIFILIFSTVGSILWSQQSDGPIPVSVEKNGDKWELIREGKPYYIKGVGGHVYLDKAKAYGANSVRIWSADFADEALDEAHKRGMTVLFGLWMGQERQGFDYDDSKAVASQLARFTEIVKTYKDHPAILMWCIGNETDLFYSDFKMWNALNDIAKMVHEVDPHHPTMTVTAGFDIAEIQLVQERAPHIDVYGVNTYGELLGADKVFRAAGWEGAYVITEWGPTGHWEVPKTEWNVPIEQTSTEKAAAYKLRYQKGIYQDQEKCIGSYVFLWGQKQETTPTWYGVFLPDGTETEVMDVLEYVWTGSWPENRAPSISSYTLNNKTAYESLYVNSGQKVSVDAAITDPEGDKIDYKWELLPESTDIKTGGDAEDRPDAVPLKILTNSGGKLMFRAPAQPGPYRLFLYAYDGNGNAATANFPFYVNE